MCRWEVRKENPPKQGLKLFSASAIPMPFMVRKENPPKQGLKQDYQRDKYLMAGEVRKENPPKQGLKLQK